ncbi:hypothetical protein F441_03219 [Phytophthora nicotianae CJ01A1]|nr:hypothetical protein F441_03219 [Phytophthora nicotianae CJ01A1]
MTRASTSSCSKLTCDNKGVHAREKVATPFCHCRQKQSPTTFYGESNVGTRDASQRSSWIYWQCASPLELPPPTYLPVRDRVAPIFVEHNPALLGVSAAVTLMLLRVLYFERSRRFVNVLILMLFSAAQAATFVGLVKEGIYNYLMSPLVAGALYFVVVVCVSCKLFMIYGTRFVTSTEFGLFQFILLAWLAWDAEWMFLVVPVDEYAYRAIYIYTDIVLSVFFSIAWLASLLGSHR